MPEPGPPANGRAMEGTIMGLHLWGLLDSVFAVDFPRRNLEQAPDAACFSRILARVILVPPPRLSTRTDC